MKTLTITLRATPGVPVPESSNPFVQPFAVRITVTRPDGSTAQPPAEDKLTWVFGGLQEGQTYRFLMEVVDAQGRTIQALPEASLTVPAADTFTRLDGFDVSWS